MNIKINESISVDIWNDAAKKAENGNISIFDCNDIWGALRILEKHGYTSLGLDPD